MTITSILTLALICVQLIACSCNKQIESMSDPDITANTDTMKLKITVGPRVFTATMLDNTTVTAFKTKLPLAIKMTELNRNEKYADLLGALPVNAANPGTILNGDLMLYGASTLVLFYKTFSTSYSYTRLGRIDDPSGLAEALGPGDVTVRFELD